MKFKASLDSLAKIVTIGITALFAAIIITQINILREGYSSASIFTIVALVVVYFVTYAFSPVSYSLTNDELIIQRPLINKRIARNEIQSIEQLVKGELKWSLRVFGVGGMFGYFGRFTKGSIGSMIWYATRRDKAVLLKTIHNRNIVITPDDYQKFITEFNYQHEQGNTTIQ